MTIRSNLLLAGALLLGTAGQALAATGSFPLNNVPNRVTTNAFYGGGASLPAPYLRQAGDCWGDKIDLAFRGVAATTAIPDFTANPSFNCATKQVVPAGNAVSYISTGSGRGILGWFAHTPFFNGPGAVDSWLGAATGPQAPAVYGTKTNFAASEAGLPRTDSTGGGDIDTYNGAVAGGKNVTQSKSTIGIRDAAGAYTGTAAHVYPNPLKTYGRAIQIPLLVAVPAIAFQPVYKKVNVNGTETDTAFANAAGGSGSIKLSNTQLCNIFQGKDTNLGQDGLAATFGVRAGDNASAIPIEIVGRSDGSGTTSIFYRHLEKICGAGNKYTIDANTAGGNAPTSLPSALQGPAYDKSMNNFGTVTPVPGKFTLADGNDGVAKYLAFTQKPAANQTVTQFRIGYVGNDFVLPYVMTNNQNTYMLQSAALQNKAGNFVAATPLNALAGFTVLPPQSNADGSYNAAAPGSRADPATNSTANTWVSAANIASPLADPTGATAYPLIGTTNGLFFQCYANTTEAANIRSFLSWFYTSSVNTATDRTGILAANGLAPVTPAYQRAINDTFATNNLKNLNLDIQPLKAFNGTVTPECTGVTTGA